VPRTCHDALITKNTPCVYCWCNWRASCLAAKQQQQQKNQEKVLVSIFVKVDTVYEHIELPAQLLDYFERSNKSNVNQRCTRNTLACLITSGTRVLSPSQTIPMGTRCHVMTFPILPTVLVLRGCVHPGCRLRASGICAIPCVHPLPKSLLRASVKMACLVARIGTQKDPCVHPFQKWPLHVSVFRVSKKKHLDPNIWKFGFYYRGFTTGIGFN